MKPLTDLPFAARHFQHLNSLRIQCCLLAAGLEKLLESDFKRFATLPGIDPAGGDIKDSWATARKSALQSLMVSALRGTRNANSIFLKNVQRALGLSESACANSPDASGSTGSAAARGIPSAVYRGLMDTLQLDPRHQQALGSLEALEIFSAPRRSKPNAPAAPGLPPKSFLYLAETTRREGGPAIRRVSAVPLKLKSPGDADGALLARIFDTSMVCSMHVAARLLKNSENSLK